MIEYHITPYARRRDNPHWECVDYFPNTKVFSSGFVVMGFCRRDCGVGFARIFSLCTAGRSVISWPYGLPVLRTCYFWFWSIALP